MDYFTNGRSSFWTERASHVLRRSCKRFSKPECRLSSESLQCLMEHFWPGNLPEFEAVLERAAITVSHHEILPSDLKLPEIVRDTPIR